MILGRVTGNIYSTINHPFYDGAKLLIVERLDDRGELTGSEMVAMDTVGAGVGQDVLVLDEGTGARQIVGSTTAPLRSVIVGIIDDISVVSAA